MTKVNISLSMPTVMAGTYVPEWAYTIDSNRGFFEDLSEMNPLVAATYHRPGMDPHQLLKVSTGPTEEQYYIPGTLDGLEYIQYEVLVEHIKTHGTVNLNTLTQISVWRNTNYSSSRLPNVSKWVFWRILFPRFGSMLTDRLQSEDGKRFWMSRLAEAFEREYHIYALNMSKKHEVRSIQVMTKLHEVDKYYTYAPDYSGSDHRILVSENRLSI